MNTELFRHGWQTELYAWTWRGILCATPSFCWAWLAGFRTPQQMAAMLAGVICCILVFAAGTSWLLVRSWGNLVRALKFVSSFKAAITVILLPWWFGTFGLLSPMGAGILRLEWPDLVAGIASLEVASSLTGATDSLDLARQDSFGVTLLITLIQGALVSLLLVVLGMSVLGVQGGWRRMRGSRILPAAS